MRGDFHLLLPASPWQWLEALRLLVALLGLTSFTCHAITRQIKRYKVAIFSHLVLTAFLLTSLCSIGYFLLSEQATLVFTEQMILYALIFIVSFGHLIGTWKIATFLERLSGIYLWVLKQN